MADPLALLQQRGTDWLMVDGRDRLLDLVELRLREIQQHDRESLPRILLAAADPVQFVAGFLAASSACSPVFLCNPHWAAPEWQQILPLIQPDLVWTDYNATAIDPVPSAPHPAPPVPPGTILIPTGGSSGQIRFAIHTWETLLASVTGFRKYFQLQQVHSLCVLPLYHVSGLMQVMRSFISGGTLLVQPFKTLLTDPGAMLNPEAFFISLVPTQLQRSLEQEGLPGLLSRFQAILLGGGPAWPELLAQARQLQLPLAPTYGMTETASQVATLKPSDFLAGSNSCGRVLPQAHIQILDPDGKPLEPGQTGTIVLQSQSLALGYYPQLWPTRHFQTDDLGYFDATGYLHVVGRSSDKIITGGENVFPVEVEAVLRKTGLVRDVCVIGIPEQHWGEVVCAFYVPTESTVSQQQLKAAIAPQLSPFKQPKHWVALAELPRNPQGKLDRNVLRQMPKIPSEPD
ncbi:2-succinylbenzoate-CoA ligase [Leptolyngbya sp. 'hensonii']|uniref:2-succinylbenzoate--CoA ligase n=1 Tax=Leptolyngbya sp. 'hensonii' TaxID=1922337 RepID=UPI00094F5EC7|nr:2-succinylbenzoate--CoA ligase [Leptolyngbya sp. 'hensonii']OLP17259.1 2-succinylbenzoate-CoA ligase [Leptolyngbya sp. 'hensonii']